jgi:hypothetical protein
MSGNRVDRRLSDGRLPDVAGFGRILQIGVIALLSIIWATAAPADDAPNSRLSDDVALTKAAVSSLTAQDFKAVRDRFDPAIGQVSDDALRQMSGLMGASEPASIETIWATETHNLQTGDGNSRIILEYKLPAAKWVVADAVVKTQGGSKRFTRLYLTANALPLNELNAFHLFGKGSAQYLFLAGWIAVIALVIWAMTIAFRRHSGWRRWVLIVLMPSGLTPTVALNWNTAHVWVLEAVNNPAGAAIPIIAFRYPMTMFGRTETLVPYLYVSAPLIALGYLIWYWGWTRRRPLASPSNQAN